jgi:hypothetical protein
LRLLEVQLDSHLKEKRNKKRFDKKTFKPQKGNILLNFHIAERQTVKTFGILREKEKKIILLQKKKGKSGKLLFSSLG